jgi:hypothetical protein
MSGVEVCQEIKYMSFACLFVSFDCDFEGYAHQDTDCFPSSFEWEALSHLLWFLFLPGTVTDLYVAPSPSAVSEVLKSPNIHDLQVYGVILTVVLCLIVFGGVKIINRVSPAFLVPAVLSVFFIYIGIFASPRKNDPVGVTGLRLSTLRNNLDPAYQRTNNAGIPASDGSINWTFEYVRLSYCSLYHFAHVLQDFLGK